MKNNFDDGDMLCPFYCGSNKNNIICEGLTENTTMVSYFELPSEKKRYQFNYCMRYDYMDCPYAKIIDEIKYIEENDMGKSVEEKLKSATQHIKELQEEKRKLKAQTNALQHQIDWREKERKKSELSKEATELLTKYLVYSLSGKDELRVSIKSMAEMMAKYDVILVHDKTTNEIVLNLVDKENNRILDENYNDYINYITKHAQESAPKRSYSNFMRIKKPASTDRNNIIKKALKNIKREAGEAFGNEIKKMNIEYRTFEENKGSIIVAWIATEK